ncbi:MAG: PKD domain-containing protein [Planctomycetota bacterium]|nr:PKD domain-containing protein [Planctomycetota bacterium]
MALTIVVNHVPVATASGSPTSGAVPLTVAFVGGGTDADNDTLSYLWDFGDGTPASTTQNPSHTFSAVSTYTVTLTVSDGKGGTAAASVVIKVVAAGGVLPGDTDSDGDGFSDQIETQLGSNPDDASDTPGGATKPTAAGKLSVSKLGIRLNFAKPEGNDSIALSGLLLIPDGFTVAGQTAIVDIGGVVKSFTLNGKGKSPKGSDSFAVGVKARRTGTPLQVAKFAVKLLKGSFAAALADDGLINASTTAQVTVPVTLIFNGEVLQKAVSQSYKAVKDKAGATK